MLRLNYVAVAGAMLWLSGCNSDPGPKAVIEKVVPVSGTLTYQGKPLENFQVTLVPSDGRRAAVGITDKNGKFTMGTNETGDGAPPGTHKVAVSWAGPPAETGATEQIVDEPEKLPKADVSLPATFANPETSGLTQEVPEAGLTDWKLDLK